MRHRSKIWTKLAARGRFLVDVKAVIDGKEYFKISAPKIERMLLSDPMSVGNCGTATLQLSILTDDDIPSTSPIIIKARLVSLDETIVSEYLEFGTFYIDQRESCDGLLSVTCYDSMLKTSQAMVDETDNEEDWPKAMTTVVSEIALRIGVPVDPRTKIKVGLDYLVPWPAGRTMQQVLGYIGACHGGNWIITEENNLRLVPLVTAPDDTCHILDADYEEIITGDGSTLSWKLIEYSEVGQREQPGDPVTSYLARAHNIVDHEYNKIVTSDGFYLVWAADGSADAEGGIIHVPVVVGKITTGKTLTVSKVTMTDENSNTYSAGDDTGSEILIEGNPYASQGVCDDLYAILAGLQYAPYEASNACFDPGTELGDQVKIGDKVCSVIYTMSLTLGDDYRNTISAPNNKEASREFPFLTNSDKADAKEYIESGVTYGGVSLNETDGLTVVKSAAAVAAASEDGVAAVAETDEISHAEVNFSGKNITLRGRSATTGKMEDNIYYDDEAEAYRITKAVVIEQVDDLEDEVSTLSDQVATLQDSTEQGNTTTAQLVAAVAALQTSNDAQDVVLARLEADTATLKQGAADNASAITDNGKGISDNATAIANNATAISDNKKAIEANGTAIAANATAIAAVQTELAEVKSVVNGHTETLAEILSLLKTLTEGSTEGGTEEGGSGESGGTDDTGDTGTGTEDPNTGT